MNAPKLNRALAMLLLAALAWGAGLPSRTARAQVPPLVPVSPPPPPAPPLAPGPAPAPALPVPGWTISDDGTTTTQIKQTTTQSTDGVGAPVSKTTYATNIYRLDKPETLSLENNYVQINSGVALLNPYKLTTNGPGTKKNVLTDEDTEAQFYLEFAASYIWAWNYHRRYDWLQSRASDNECIGWKKMFQGTKKIGNDYSGELGLGFPDFSGRINYISQDDDQTTATAIIGSGEFGLEATLGIPFYQAIDSYSGRFDSTRTAKQLYNDTISAHWLGTVISWSGVTDASSFDIHNRVFVGVGYRAAFKAPWESTATPERREVVINFQAGTAWLDAVKFTDTTSNEIETIHDDKPRYYTRTSFGMEAEMLIPINKTLNGTVGARLYPIRGNESPNAWNAYLGLTIPLSKLTSILQ